MGYDLHITRRSHWADEDDDITLDEWAAYARTDPSIRIDGFAETRLPDGRTLRINEKGLAVWIGSDGEVRTWFSYHEGCISSKNPDRVTIQKMWTIAQAFGATVQGDEGELYGADGEMIRD